MKLFFSVRHLIPFAFLFFYTCSNGQENNSSFIIGDALPDAPALALRGEYKVGVRTLEFIHNNQLDILHSKDGKDTIYNRPLKVEVWYPALVPTGKKELETYHSFLGLWKDSVRPLTPFTFRGVRCAMQHQIYRPANFLW